MHPPRQMAILLVFFAVLFGTYVRLAPVIQAGFPLNDGGLFYSMTRDLVQSGFCLPETTTFNQLNIPFAYPPLPFYLAGVVFVLTRIPLLEIIRWLPLLFSLLTIPAFYLLARSMLESPAKAALATVIFALLPRSYDWLVMGGGLTRAPATVFLLLMAWATFRAFRESGWKLPLLAALFGGLVLLTHPERALHAAITGLLFWLWLGRSRVGTWKALAIGAGALLVSAPWWLTVLFRFGTGELLLAARAGGSHWLFWVPFLQLNFTDEVAPLVAVLAIIGLFVRWHQRKGLLPFWFILIFLADPRSAPNTIAIQASMLAALALTEVILPALGKFAAMDWLETLNTSLGRGVLGYILIVMLFNAQWNLLTLGTYVLSPAERQAIDWISTETPSQSRFLVLGWQETPMLSPVLEWFPALSGRVNIVTIQGREWLGGDQHFTARLQAYPHLFACLYQDAACLADWAKANGDTFDFVFLSLQVPGGETRQSLLSTSLLNSNQYQLVYENPQVIVFQHLP
jgi:hypothetical protein